MNYVDGLALALFVVFTFDWLVFTLKRAPVIPTFSLGYWAIGWLAGAFLAARYIF